MIHMGLLLEEEKIYIFLINVDQILTVILLKVVKILEVSIFSDKIVKLIFKYLHMKFITLYLKK